MTPDRQRPYGKWSSQELRNAESTASHFLDENRDQIADTLRAKARLLEALIQRIGSKKTTFEERLEFFARVAEVAQLIEEDADGFFRLASEPVVARILSGVPKK